jgi:predicted lysophospholipase L1 biosynthesis ABC-type transport system permease subunit
MASPRVTTILLRILAALALVISVSGIAGIMALSVSQRTRELGIRMALGQSRESVIYMVVRQGLVIAMAWYHSASRRPQRLAAFLSQQFLEDSHAFVYVFFLQKEWG